MTQMQPRVSAIITAYNSASYIGGAIESIMAQTRPADEIIVIDDGSTDETAAIIDSYSSQGVRRVTQKNQGPSAARNRGVAESRGELIAFLDADDLWLPEKLAEQTDYFATHPNAVLVSCNRWRWILPEDRRRLEHYGPSSGKNARSEVLIQNMVGNPSMVLLRRTALEKAGLFNLAMRWAEDWELWTRIGREGDLGFIEKPLIIYRSHSSSLSYEKEALHFPIQFAIARQAIISQRPLYNQPLDLVRARSVVETQRAFYAVNRGLPRIQQIWYALCAFASYPFERTGQKLGLIFRAIVGDSIYRRVQKKQQTPVLPPTLQYGDLEMTSVIMLVNEFPPLPAGGAEKQAERLSVYMASRGARVKVLTRAGGQLLAHEQRNGFQIERIAAQGPYKLGTILFTFGTMLVLFRQRKTYQVLHAHLAFAPAVAAALIGRLLNKKVIVKFGNSGSFGDIQVSQNSFLGRLKLAMLRRWVNANVVLDEIMEAELLSAGFNRQRVIRMVNGIDTNAFSRRNEQGVAKSMLGMANKTVLLFVGRLVPQKALPDLLIALNLLLKAHPNIHLFLLGKGEEQLHLEQQAQALGISEHITFTGNVDDVQPYLDAADLFVLPSLAEGISNALLEAMTAGLPCVATSVGGTPEVLDNGACGILVPPNTPETLAASISKLIDQPTELTRLGIAARERILQHYALPVAGDRYLELYSRLILKEQAGSVGGSLISVADTEVPSS